LLHQDQGRDPALARPEPRRPQPRLPAEQVARRTVPCRAVASRGGAVGGIPDGYAAHPPACASLPPARQGAVGSITWALDSGLTY
ncbi:MAG: hypothetical protein KBF43_14030, partial [Dermatophilaceae bacterium]|nr:hypothetical protein [Dermatophilaceae bacterium]